MALLRGNAANWLVLTAVVCCWCARARAQTPPDAHYQHHAAMPPGAIGTRQLLRGRPLVGHFQPVEIVSPSGAGMALAAGGRFLAPARQITAAMLIGPVYRLRVVNIPNHPGEEVYPTVELIDRTYPPSHMAARFPVTVEIALVDLELALAGKFVTRVIYLEDPRNALPAPHAEGHQEWFDVGRGRDPLQTADALGRPIAILRMGGREPTNVDQPGMRFLYGCPPFKPLPAVPRLRPAAPKLKQPKN